MMPFSVARDMMVADPVTLTPEMEVLDAVDLLLRHELSVAPVVDHDDRFVGLFSETTCLRLTLDDDNQTTVSDTVMSYVDPFATVIHEEADAESIADTFGDEACRRLPVLDEEGRLRGIISRRDLLRAIRERMRDEVQATADSGHYLNAIFNEPNLS